jgi:hypothetical protein
MEKVQCHPDDFGFILVDIRKLYHVQRIRLYVHSHDVRYKVPMFPLRSIDGTRNTTALSIILLSSVTTLNHLLHYSLLSHGLLRQLVDLPWSLLFLALAELILRLLLLLLEEISPTGEPYYEVEQSYRQIMSQVTTILERFWQVPQYYWGGDSENDPDDQNLYRLIFFKTLICLLI